MIAKGWLDEKKRPCVGALFCFKGINSEAQAHASR